MLDEAIDYEKGKETTVNAAKQGVKRKLFDVQVTPTLGRFISVKECVTVLAAAS